MKKDTERTGNQEPRVLVPEQRGGGVFEVSLSPHAPQPAITCYFNLEAWRYHFYTLWIFTEAFEEVCVQQKIEFDKNNRQSWEELQNQRPDLIEAAQSLADNPKFFLPIAEEASGRADFYMKFIDGEQIMKSVSLGLDVLTREIKLTVTDKLRLRVGLEERETREKHRDVLKLARKYTSDHAKIKKGRNPGSKSHEVKCTYEKLKQAICALDKKDGTIPNKKAVAKKLGFQGQYMDDALGNWLKAHQKQLTENHGHSTHIFKQVAKEILKL